MTPAISAAGLSRRYRGQLALDQVNFDIEPGSITGLLGRNGAGKTTLLRIVAGQEFPSSGRVAVLGDSPVDSEKVLRQMVFIREDQRYPDYGSGPGFQVRHALRAASWFYPNWDAELGRRAGRGLLPGQFHWNRAHRRDPAGTERLHRPLSAAASEPPRAVDRGPVRTGRRSRSRWSRRCCGSRSGSRWSQALARC